MNVIASESVLKPAPVGELIDLGGYRLHLHSQGIGSPAVIMEAAMWDFGLTWSLVQPEVARFTRAVVYDRGGLGWSDPSRKPRTAEAMVDELHTLLQRAGIAGPYVLVGQSFSGLLVRLFAYTYPDELAGLVLVDAAHEDQFERFPEPIRSSAEPMRQAQLQQFGQLREVASQQGPEAVPPLIPVPPQFPVEIADTYRALAANTVARLDTMIAEFENLPLSQSQVRAVRDRGLGDTPMIVLSHGIPQSVPGLPDEVNRDYEATWQQLQAELTAFSASGKRLIAENAGHMIHHDRPDLVIAAIREAVETAR